ncbi:MAG: alkaline phosphatase family protein [Bacteroidetes bacterium]|nr:MAG: alkaline phosphatase family protein [Bacteroidota bacterium]
MLVSQFVFAQDTTQKIVPGRTNSPEQAKKPYVILISADGFRYDLADRYQARELIRLRQTGIESEYLQPGFPSLTFPNHYTIATGLYPSHHGVVDNTFYDESKQAVYSLGNKTAVTDSSWYGGEPLWVLAEKQKMLSASFYWVASESAIEGVRPTYYYNYNEAIPIDKRIEIVKNWLQLPEEKRPHLITFYFPEVDHQEHRYGVDSKEAIEAVQFVDQSIGKMVKSIDSLGLPVNYIFVSDHGMVNIDTVNTIRLPGGIDTSKFVMINGLTIVHIYAKNTSDIAPAYELLKANANDYDVYLSSELPARWHYSKGDDVFHRIGDIVLVAHSPKIFNYLNRRRLPAAEHGYDPGIPDMHATFYAWGPAFRKHMKIKGFENINIYPLIAQILGLEVTQPIDGNLNVLKRTLNK